MDRRQAVGCRRSIGVGGIAGGEGPLNLAGADRIDHHPLAADEIEDGEIGAGLLGEADGVPGMAPARLREVAAAEPDRLGVVDIERRAMGAGEVGHAHAGDCLAETTVGRGLGGHVGGGRDHGTAWGVGLGDGQ